MLSEKIILFIVGNLIGWYGFDNDMQYICASGFMLAGGSIKDFLDYYRKNSNGK